MARETVCQTPDTNFKTIISGSSVAVVVDLPFNLELDEGEAEQLETNIHNALELVFAPFFYKP